MADNASNNTEVLVLSDASGNMYAIPLSVLEQHKVTDEQRPQVEEALGGDEVSGYGWAMNAAANRFDANAAANANANAVANADADAYANNASAAAASNVVANQNMLSGMVVNLGPALSGKSQLDTPGGRAAF